MEFSRIQQYATSGSKADVDFLKDDVLPLMIAKIPGQLSGIELFCKLIFPERFTKPFDKGHYEMIELIDQFVIEGDDGKRKLAAHRFAGATAFRGCGKTSLVALAMPAHYILFRLAKYIVYVNNTADNAVLQTENLRRELLSNTIIKRLFPEIKPNSLKGMDESFGKNCWVANDHTMVRPRGSGQQVRGLLYRNSRPDLIICDDLEDTETIGSERVRKKREDWLFSDLFESVSAESEEYRVFYIDTLKHKQAIPNKLKQIKKWKFVNVPLCNDDFKTNFPRFVSQHRLDEMVQSARDAGLMYLFYREKMGKIVHGDEQSFKLEYFKYYEEPDEVFKKAILQSVVLIDPARTTTQKSADSAIVGVSVDAHNHRIYVRDIVHAKLHPDEIYRESFEMAMRIGAKTLGYEDTGLHEHFDFHIRNAMTQAGLWFDIVPLRPRKAKDEHLIGLDLPGKAMRVAQLLPFYRQGQVYHNKTNCGVLESQLLDFPEPDLWDVCDAFSYITQMMELGLQYFHRSNGYSEFPEEDEYEGLDLDDSEPLKLDNAWEYV